VAGGDSYVEMEMNISPRDSSVLMLVKNAPYVPSVNPEDWQHVDPRSSTEFDYEGMVTARTQIAHIASPGLGAKVYIYLINFERKMTPSYALNVSEVSVITYKCATPIYYGSTFYCDSCLTGTTGVFCSISNHELSEYGEFSVAVQPSGYALFTLLASGDVTVSIMTSKGGISVYFQYNLVLEETAGLVNYINDGSVLGHDHYAAAGTYGVELKNGGNTVALGVLNSNSSVVTVRVSFQQDSTSIILTIAFIVMGVVVLIGIIATIVVAIRRARGEGRVGR
jgi:hypothetical protein